MESLTKLFQTKFKLRTQFANPKTSPVDYDKFTFSMMILNAPIFLGILVIWLILARKYKFSEKLILTWYWVDACTHLILEHAFVILSIFGASSYPANIWIDAWKEYGLADRRWAYKLDPTVVSLEILTVYVVGPLCLFAFYGQLRRSNWFHSVQVTIAVAELYGGCMTFFPEWLTANPSLDGSNPKYLFLYLIFFNAIWVVVPFILLYHSWIYISDSVKQREFYKEKTN